MVLFSSIPIDQQALLMIEEFFISINEYILFTTLRMEQNAFSFRDKLFKQTFGTFIISF